MLLKKGKTRSPSLRRHYPDQVYGYYLSQLHHSGFRRMASTPGTLKTYRINIYYKSCANIRKKIICNRKCNIIYKTTVS
jgi:hypothetical protein